MKRTAWAVAALGLLFGTAVVTASPNPNVLGAPHAAVAQQQDPSNPHPAPALQTFTGTITKTGDQFVLTDDGTKASYQLDDQKSASKFDGMKVKVIGTLDASNNTIRVQSIEAAAA